MADGKSAKILDLSCPLPRVSDDRIVLGHGGGGRLTHQLIEKIFLPAFRNPQLEQRHDGAVLPVNGSRLAFTTDSFVVRPLIFPGGNIGDLAVHGTVNDLAMCGARPLYLSAGFILEEGLEMETLRTVVDSMRAAALSAGVQLVTGDTKVVDKGKGDGIFINTSGIGVIESAACTPGSDVAGAGNSAPAISPAAVQPGDAVIVSGDLGRHGIAILSVREGLEFESPILTDSANVWPAVEALLRAGIEVHCLRDLTRGGLATTLNEIAGDRKVCISLDEKLIPVDDTVQGACEILGLDPLYVANEGRFAAFVPPSQAGRALEILRSVPVSSGSVCVGTVEAQPRATVVLRSRIGGNRVVDMLSGEQLPRIC
jgi:hydrogenase expression/formation protein HypE